MAVYNGDDLDRSFGAYVFISLILHAMLFFVFPRWDFAVGPGLFAGPGGGIISVVPIEVQQPARTQVTRQQPQQQTPNRQTATPAKQEPEPVETAKTQVTQTPPEAAPKPQIPRCLRRRMWSAITELCRSSNRQPASRLWPS